MNNNNKVKMPKNESDEIWVLEFTPESAQEFRDQLLKAAKDPNQPIIIYIDSYGGYVDSLAKMIATMDEVPNPLITVAMGKAMSCGAILLSHGDIRWCDRHSRIMIHEVSGVAQGDVHDVMADSIEHKRLNKYFLGLLAKNCGIKDGYDGLRRIIKDRDGRDMYLDASSAVKFGIVDAVGTPKVSAITLYDVQTVPQKAKPLREHIKKQINARNKK